MLKNLDRHYLARALRLAEKGLFTTDPNPRVGCVLVQGEVVVGEGFHLKAGEPHAEALALAQAGSAARGATAYVTLEPCSYHGRTPSCAEALISAGVNRVVAAMTDPHPRNRGQGFDMLEQAGIEVERDADPTSARLLNPGHVTLHELGRPYVRVKLAATLDGRTSLMNGQSQWITGAAARRDVQKWRARSSALITGVGTILADDPTLTVRDTSIGPDVDPDWLTRPRPVWVLDPQQRTPSRAKVWNNPMAAIVHAENDKTQESIERSVSCVLNEARRIDLEALLALCASREMKEVLFECGPTLAGSVIQSGLWDELILYLAPKLMGPGQSLLHWPEIDNMSALAEHEIASVRQLGPDLRLIIKPSVAVG